MGQRKNLQRNLKQLKKKLLKKVVFKDHHIGVVIEFLLIELNYGQKEVKKVEPIIECNGIEIYQEKVHQFQKYLVLILVIGTLNYYNHKLKTKQCEYFLLNYFVFFVFTKNKI